MLGIFKTYQRSFKEHFYDWLYCGLMICHFIVLFLSFGYLSTNWDTSKLAIYLLKKVRVEMYKSISKGKRC